MKGLRSYLIIASNLENAPLPPEVKVPGIDTCHLVVDQLGIDDARYIVEQSYKKPLTAEFNSIVIVSKKLTVEAENALLKLFEEPPESTALYLVVPHESLIISTLRSRFVTVLIGSDSVDISEAEKFLSMSYKDRLELIAAKAKIKDNSWMELLVKNVGLLLKGKKKISSHTLRPLALVESYIRIRGASKKQLLEELALSLEIEK